MRNRTPSSSPASRVDHLSLLSEALAGTNAIRFESQTSRAHRMCRVAIVPTRALPTSAAILPRNGSSVNARRRNADHFSMRNSFWLAYLSSKCGFEADFTITCADLPFFVATCNRRTSFALQNGSAIKGRFCRRFHIPSCTRAQRVCLGSRLRTKKKEHHIWLFNEERGDRRGVLGSLAMYDRRSGSG
jgi:hypothetical protein